ncbi:IS1096 element passenger TnpR family protein [Mesorhizobium yinganensis]|uniref:IS1096 element passenger TnpR family protein n=1 Tax=Mesorhizobium yinganensis TaxID=3157707 RepID=UPI0032B84F37
MWTGERHRDASGREIMLADHQLRVRQRILYEYDFGDLWEHEIRVEAKLEREGGKAYPVCIRPALSRLISCKCCNRHNLSLDSYFPPSVHR